MGSVVISRLEAVGGRFLAWDDTKLAVTVRNVAAVKTDIHVYGFLDPVGSPAVGGQHFTAASSGRLTLKPGEGREVAVRVMAPGVPGKYEMSASIYISLNGVDERTDTAFALDPVEVVGSSWFPSGRGVVSINDVTPGVKEVSAGDRLPVHVTVTNVSDQDQMAAVTCYLDSPGGGLVWPEGRGPLATSVSAEIAVPLGETRTQTLNLFVPGRSGLYNLSAMVEARGTGATRLWYSDFRQAKDPVRVSDGSLGGALQPDTDRLVVLDIVPDRRVYKPGDQMMVSVTLANMTSVDSQGIVELYVDAPAGERPWKEPGGPLLRGVDRPWLLAGQRKTVTIELLAPDRPGVYDLSVLLSIRNPDNTFVHGDFAYWAGQLRIVSR